MADSSARAAKRWWRCNSNDKKIDYCCKRAAPTEGFDDVRLVLSSESKVISITGVLRSGDKAACERKAKELAAKYKAEFAARESAAGTMVFEVNYGTNVEVVLAAIATKRLSDRAFSASARR